jgi:hypothetical protein
MNELKKADLKAWEWLSNVPTKLWCKHAFSFYPKCDVLMNNISEAFNATILVARDKPILTMCEWIRTYLMNRTSTIRSKLGKWQHDIMPMPRKRLNVEVEGAGNWIATWGNNLEFEVELVGGGKRFSVDLTKRTCSCNFWELVGIPCRHAITAMSKIDENPENYVSEWYSRKTYETCYSFNVSTINGQDMWPDIEYEEMLPPVYKRAPGRPKKLRRRGGDEPRPGKWSRRVHGDGPINRCTTCNAEGHNAKSCKSLTIDPEAAKRKVNDHYLFQ